ncbi:hypothetical protein PSEUBRA_005986 [Kalmanozyma brasiliensis GHG001]|uniref:Uncharacterized protein n=1 Tax=Kalmanozyma brasiliensis (strain GHG001) TaxID=1365824 RepID=V5GFB9_KALBG|nr:uncharacterized protein PSEUBRA_005986 [Kalmanozyma brasiliensis GHG001]EST04707.1 hypothetical protein PSEUBRA_005986 [Kalmanozyma brasiliensis GHG001]
MSFIPLFRTVASRRAVSTGLRSFSTTSAARSAVKPGSESEATTPGSGPTEDIANSDGAYDGSRTNPHASTSKIESETDADFDQSSANQKTSELASKQQHQSNRRPSKQQQSQPDRDDFGASEARKQGGRGGSQA